MGDDGPVDDPGVTGQGWAVPGSVVDQPVPEVPMPVAPAEPRLVSPDGEAPRPGPDAVPSIPLMPRTTADILDGGFAVLKARPARIIGLTAAFVVPLQLVAAYIQRDYRGGVPIAELITDDPTVLNEQANGTQGAEIVVQVGLIVLSTFALVCVAAGLAHLVTQWTMGRDPRVGELFGVIARRSWPLLVTFVVVKLAEIGGGLACYIGLPFVVALFVPVAPVVAVEGLGPFASLGRATRLARARYWPTLGIALLMGLTSWLLRTALSALPQALAGWVGLDRAWPILALGGIAAEVIVVPFVAAATVLLYLDLRVRTEGLDIEMAAGHVLDRRT
jgi:hypothetical protein